MKISIRKGPADPFRGEWYVDVEYADRLDVAIAKAMQLTLSNFREFEDSWMEFGYEWSVFEGDRKVWEGFKAIQNMSSQGRRELREGDGWMDN